MDLQPVGLPHKRGPVSNSQGILVNLLGPSFSDEYLVNNRTEKEKITGVFFSACSFIWIFFFFQFEKNKNTLSEQRAEHIGVIQRGGVGPGSRVGYRWEVGSSLVVVAVFQVFTLNVSSTVVCARELNTILVYTPADASFASTRGFALFALEKSFSVTVGKIQRQSHHTGSVLHSLNDPIQFSPAWTKFRLMLVDRQWGVVQGGAHGALLALLPLLLFSQCMDFFTVHNVFGKQWHFGWLQLLCNLCGDDILMRLTIYGRVRRFVSFLVGAHSPAVEQGVQRLLFPAPRQAAEALGARPGVHAACLPLRQGACKAAAAARLFDQLAADRDGRAHGQRLGVTRLTRHV